MSEYKASIEKICKFSFAFTNIDIAFIDSSSNIQFEFCHTKVPESLRPYCGKVDDLINIHDYNSGQDALIHLTSYMTSFISVKVCSDSEYLGSIVVGPYLSEEPDMLMIENIIFENKLAISLKKIMKQYYLSLPLISTYKAKLMAESLAYSVLNLHSISSYDISIGNEKYNSQTECPLSPNTLKENIKYSIDLIEKKYNIENELLHAVEMGNIEKMQEKSEEVSYLFRDVQERVPYDPLRSRKNLAFVINTLFRKASEKGGLHPMDLHSISEKYAVQIEQTTTLKQLGELMRNMGSDYCNAVRKLSLKNYNYLTQKAIEFIRKNLDGDLSLQTISSAIDVSPYELSRQFKKETGQSITIYINIQRINEAVYIMQNKNISITDIAYMVGFNDVTYFTKVFKKLKGMTPSKYRKSQN